MNAIKINQLLDFLGKPLTNNEIESFLQEIKVKRRPSLDENDIEEGVFNKWIPIKRLGLEFEFRNQSNFETLEDEEVISSPLVLASLIFYHNRDDMKDYPFELPYSLNFTYSPEEVRKIFAPLACSLKSYLRDVFVFSTHQVIVSYNQERTEINDIFYMLLPGLKAIKTPDIPFPSVESFIKILDEPHDSPNIKETLNFFDIQDFLEEQDTVTPYFLVKNFGLGFDFEEYESDEADENLLTGISFHTKGYLDFSKGYKGDLPLGLSFSYSIREIMSQIKIAPLHWSEDEFQGTVRWILNDFSIQVDYSNLMNYTAKISIYPTWYWDDEYRSDWEIAPLKFNKN